MRSIIRMLATSLAIGLIAAAVLSGFEREVLTVAHVLCLGLIWFTGIRALMLWARSRKRTRREPAAPSTPLRIALLYCTADDLNPAALRESSAQDIPVDLYLLDDSTTTQSRASVDAIAADLGAQVLRRADRVAAKARNLNHALSLVADETEAIVVLDSDTVIPRDFARRCAAVLASDDRIACVQAVPVASGQSAFARFFGPLVRSHARINHATRSRIGFPAFVGRGAMLRYATLRQVGGFPAAVSEDLALSVRLREHGAHIVHRPDIEFREDFPVDYAAFRVQQAKAAEGAAEFLLSSRNRTLPRRERADLLLETALLPIGAAAGLGALALGAMLALWGYPTPAALSAVSAVLALAPLLPEAARRAGMRAPLSAAMFLTLTPLLYASVAPLVLGHALAVLGGRRARFVVTPKSAAHTGLAFAVESLRREYSWAIVALVVATCLGVPLLGIPFAVPAAAGTALLLLGARSRIRLSSRTPVPTS